MSLIFSVPNRVWPLNTIFSSRWPENSLFKKRSMTILQWSFFLVMKRWHFQPRSSSWLSLIQCKDVFYNYRCGDETAFSPSKCFICWKDGIYLLKQDPAVWILSKHVKFLKTNTPRLLVYAKRTSKHFCRHFVFSVIHCNHVGESKTNVESNRKSWFVCHVFLPFFLYIKPKRLSFRVIFISKCKQNI